MKNVSDFNFFDLIGQLSLPPCRGVMQVGANIGQEIDLFLANRVSTAFLIEPQNLIFNRLKVASLGIPHFYPVQALLASQTGIRTKLFIASNEGGSTSVLSPDGHQKIWPFIEFANEEFHVSKTLDDLVKDLSLRPEEKEDIQKVNVLYMDAQGFEYEILLGAKDFLKNIDYIYSEHFRPIFYTGSRPLADYIALLIDFDFSLNNINYNRSHHAEMLFIKNSLLGLPSVGI